MQRKHVPLIFAVGITLVVIAVFAAKDRKSRDREMADLRRQIAALAASDRTSSDWGADSRNSITLPERGSDFQQREVPRSIVAKGKVGGRVPGERDRPSEHDSGLDPTAGRRQAEAMRDDLEMSFLKDHAAETWGGNSQRVATEKLNAALPEGSAVRSFDCHASMCRVESVHPDIRHYEQFVRTAFMNEGTEIWNAGFFSTPLYDDYDVGQEMITVTYVAQEGQELPKVAMPEN